jgi:uncharacterized protein (TIGR00369 family)
MMSDAGGARPEWGEPRTKTVSWWPPSVAAAAGRGLSGIDYLQAIVDGRVPPPPIASITGARLTSVGDGVAVFRCVPNESFLNPLGLVHGGLLCTLMDSAMGVAVTASRRASGGYASIELKVSFLEPVPFDGRELEVAGRALRVGRRVAFAEAHARTGDGTLIGHATSSLAAYG